MEGLAWGVMTITRTATRGMGGHYEGRPEILEECVDEGCWTHEDVVGWE